MSVSTRTRVRIGRRVTSITDQWYYLTLRQGILVQNYPNLIVGKKGSYYCLAPKTYEMIKVLAG